MYRQKISHHDLAVLGQDRFGVELDAEDRVFLVHQPHDRLVGGVCCDGQAIGNRGRVGAERVIPGNLDRVRKALENRAEYLSCAVFSNVDPASFPVNEFRRVNDGPAKGLENTLVTKADAKEGNFPCEMLDHGD